jgi:hypothetical protein
MMSRETLALIIAVGAISILVAIWLWAAWRKRVNRRHW